MSKTKKVLLMCTAYVLVAVVAIGGTLAYLTDRDSEVNTFTVGDVAIDLKEDFEQGAELLPGVRVEKEVSIENVGKNDAWVWYTYAVPTALVDSGNDSYKNAVHFDMRISTWDTYRENKNYWLEGQTEAVPEEQTWHYESTVHNIKTVVDGVDYTISTFLYNGTLAPNATTTVSLEKVYLDKCVDIDPNGDWYWVENGNVTSLNWNTNTNGTPKIYVSAYAIQADEFDTVADAYAAYNKQWGDKGSEYPPVVSSFNDLKNAAKNGGTYVLTDDIVITDDEDFYYSKYATAVFNDMTLDLNGHNIVIDVDRGSTAEAAVLFYVYSEGASLTIVGDGDVIAKHDAFVVFPRGVSEGVYIYGGNYYNNDETSGKTNDINAIVYSQTNSNIHIYGGTYTFKNVNGHCGAFNVYDNSGAEIILHEGVLLSNSNYYKGSDGDEIHLAEGCTLQEVNIDGTTWYKVVAE